VCSDIKVALQGLNKLLSTNSCAESLHPQFEAWRQEVSGPSCVQVYLFMPVYINVCVGVCVCVCLCVCVRPVHCTVYGTVRFVLYVP